jgi:hypothetical protein
MRSTLREVGLLGRARLSGKPSLSPVSPKEYVGQHVLVGTYCYCVVQCIEHVHDHVLLTPLRCGAGLRAVLHAYCPSRVVAPSMSTSTVATPVLSTKPSR